MCVLTLPLSEKKCSHNKQNSHHQLQIPFFFSVRSYIMVTIIIKSGEYVKIRDFSQILENANAITEVKDAALMLMGQAEQQL